MIENTDVLSIAYYKSKPFKGSDGNMRYMIERTEKEEGNVFTVTTWPGPLSFEATSDDKKSTHIEEFSEEGLIKVVEYLNSRYGDYN